MSKLLKNTSLYTIGNVIPQIANFFLLPIYTAYLNTSEYGIVQSMYVLTTIFTYFFTFAIDRSIYRLYFDYKTDEDKKTYLSTVSIALTIISIAILIITFLLRHSISQIYSSIDFYPYYMYAILTAFVSIYALIPKIYFQVNEKAGKFIIISILQFVFNSGFILWFVVVEKAGASGMLKGLLYANLITLPLFLYITTTTINFKFKFSILKDSLQFSLPMLPTLLSAWILNLSDRIFLERYFSLSEVGIYSLGCKIAGLVLIISTAFRLAYSPVFYKLANSDNQSESKAKISKYNYYYMLIIIFVVFIISFFSKEIIALFFIKEYYESYKIVSLISISNLFGQLSGIFNMSIYQKKKTTISMGIILITGAINVLLNFLLTPAYGMYGAAIASMFSFILQYIISFYFAQKYYYLPFNWKFVFLTFLTFVGIYLIFSFLTLSLLFVLILKIIFIVGLISLLYFYFSEEIKRMLKDG